MPKRTILMAKTCGFGMNKMEYRNVNLVRPQFEIKKFIRPYIDELIDALGECSAPYFAYIFLRSNYQHCKSDDTGRYYPGCALLLTPVKRARRG